MIIRNLNQIKDDVKSLVKSVHPNAYYSSINGAVMTGGDNDTVIEYGKTENTAWYNASEEIIDGMTC